MKILKNKDRVEDFFDSSGSKTLGYFVIGHLRPPHRKKSVSHIKDERVFSFLVRVGLIQYIILRKRQSDRP